MKPDHTRNLIVDSNNIAHIIRHAKVKTPKNLAHKETKVSEFIFKEMVDFILSFAKQNNINGIVIATEGKNIWRRDIYPEYKANRSPADDPYYENVKEAVGLLMEYFRDHTAAYVLNQPRAEADDIIAVWCQESSGVENVVLSSDKDFIQLINHRTFVYSPHVKDWLSTDDPCYDLFVKCIRGDRGDNIRSAYPRVREKVLGEAWNDKYKMLNLLETTLKDDTIVNENLKFNMKLIDLSSQPEDIRTEIQNSIENYEPSKYSEADTLRFFGDLGFRDITKLIQYNDKPLKNSPVFKINKLSSKIL